MGRGFQIDHDSVMDNDASRQIEFSAEIDGEDRDFAIDYAVLKDLSGDEPEDDALEMFERFGDEIADMCVGAVEHNPATGVVVISEADLE